MATYPQRAVMIFEGATDATPTAQQQQRVTDRLKIYRPDLVQQIATDPLNPTGAEMAQVFVTAVREWGQSWLGATAAQEQDAANAAAKAAAIAAAQADF